MLIWDELKQYSLDEQLKAFFSSRHDLVYVFSLQDSNENEDFKNRSLSDWILQDVEPSMSRYDLTYAFLLQNKTIEDLDVVMESIMQGINENSPKDYYSNPLTVSDIIGMHTGEVNIFRYIDFVGFELIEQAEFFPQLDDLEIAMKSGNDLIDGIVQKLKKTEGENTIHPTAKRRRRRLEDILFELETKHRS